jgi:hypothetical protein
MGWGGVWTANPMQTTAYFGVKRGLAGIVLRQATPLVQIKRGGKCLFRYA